MELFDTHFVYSSQVLHVSGLKTLPDIRISGKINNNRTQTLLTTLTPRWKQTSDYECTHQMAFFDTHFVYSSQVLHVSGPKTLDISTQYV